MEKKTIVFGVDEVNVAESCTANQNAGRPTSDTGGLCFESHRSGFRWREAGPLSRPTSGRSVQGSSVAKPRMEP